MKKDITSVQFIVRYILKERRFLLLGIATTVGVSIFTWMVPKIIAFIIDQGLVPKNLHLAYMGVIYLALAEGARLLSIFLSQVMYATLGQKVIERIRENMVSHLLRLPVSYFDQVSSGTLMTKVVNDVNSLTDFFQSGFVSVLGNIATMTAIFLGLMAINLKLGIVLFLAFVPIAIACRYYSETLRSIYTFTRNQLSALNSMLADFLFGMRTIRSLGISAPKYRELNGQIDKYALAQTQMVKTYALFHPTLTLGIGILILVLIHSGLPMVSEQTLKVGEWVAALSYIVSLQQPLVEISDRWNYFLAGLASIDNIRAVFAESSEKTGELVPAPFNEIEFHHVSFHYQDGGNALSDVNLKIKRGDWVGVYGQSGSGKSTLLQMIYGFYPPSLGVLTWNGIPYPDLDVKKLRGYFGVVEQFPFLFSGTVADNITLFGEHPMDVHLLRQRFLRFPLIQSILNQLDLEISERGSNLSMGQKQMIAFLRAYLSKPDVWILDEATAFFDEDAEREVLKALDELKGENGKGISVIQVAHRPEALESMDRLIFLHEGKMQERSKSIDSR